MAIRKTKPKAEKVEKAPVKKARAPRKKKAVAPAPAPVRDMTPDLLGSVWWADYRSRNYIKAVQVLEDFVCTDDAGEAHTGLAEDYLVVGAQGDVWVEPKEKFIARFVPVTPNKA